MDSNLLKQKESYLENQYAEFWIENGIIFAVHKPHLKELNLEIAKQNVNDRIKMSKGFIRPLVLDLGNMVSVDRASRQYLSEGEGIKYLSASAIVVKNQITRLAAKIYIQLDKPPIPTNFFVDIQSAVKWLEQFKYMN